MKESNHHNAQHTGVSLFQIRVSFVSYTSDLLISQTIEHIQELTSGDETSQCSDSHSPDLDLDDDKEDDDDDVFSL